MGEACLLLAGVTCRRQWLAQAAYALAGLDFTMGQYLTLLFTLIIARQQPALPWAHAQHCLAHADLETNDAVLSRRKGITDFPAQDSTADLVFLQDEHSFAIGASGAGDIFESRGEAIGDGNVAEWPIAGVGVA